MLFKWQRIGLNTHRAKVEGGWIVKHGKSMVFLPDEYHAWSLEDE